MYDIDTTNVKKGKKFFSIFLIVGIVTFIAIGGFLYVGYAKLNSLDSTTISTGLQVSSYVNHEGTTMYKPTYFYMVNGENYSCPSNTSTSIRPESDGVTIYYDSKNPSKCMSEYSKKGNYILLIALILPISFLLVAVINMKKINKRLEKIEELNQRGKLIKGLPYRLENTGMVVNNVPVQRPVVEYTLASGSTIPLYGDPRHDRKYSDADGLVDVVIDENNPDNYFIDFEINRLTGNQASDYYKGLTQPGVQAQQAAQVTPQMVQQPKQQPVQAVPIQVDSKQNNNYM